jgi:hypothetical protein
MQPSREGKVWAKKILPVFIKTDLQILEGGKVEIFFIQPQARLEV